MVLLSIMDFTISLEYIVKQEREVKKTHRPQVCKMVSKVQNQENCESGILGLPLAKAKWSDAGQQVLAALKVC